METYNQKKALVIGLGISGQSAARFLLDRGASVTGCDQRKELLDGDSLAPLKKDGLLSIHEDSPLSLQEFDLVVVSPGVPSSHPHYSKALAMGILLIGEAELALRNRESTVLGITGTNGKTTVTLMTAHILNACGIPAKAVGNIGIPLTAETSDPGTVTVAELSSFQLETMSSPTLDGAVLLNITPDHLDRYPGMEDYAKAKCRIVECLKEGGVFAVEEETYQNYRELLQGSQPVRYTDAHLIVKDQLEFLLPLDYRNTIRHDRCNLMACYALCRNLGVTPEAFFAAAETFKKPPHRIEFVTKIGDVVYYNDSKGTNIDAVICAVETMPGPVILIAGGIHKGTPYGAWIPPFKGKVQKICAIGEAQEQIEKELGQEFPTTRFHSLEQAVEHASAIAEPGTCVLLSPGCSSFDMFDNFAHRGEVFKEIVQGIARKRRQ